MQWWCAAVGVDWDWSWRAYPGVWLFIAVIASLYVLLRRLSPEADDGRPVVYALGTLALWIALDWPVGALGGGYLASLHMVQFLTISYIAAPLLLLGTPRGVFQRIARSRFARPAELLTHPFATLVGFNLIVTVTHLPGPTDYLMASQLGSFAIDMAWLGGGLLFWWPICAAWPARPAMTPPAQILYLGAQIIAGTPIFAWLAFADLPLYATYELAPRVHGISARADQQAAGLLMKSLGMPIMLVASALIFVPWARRHERADLAALAASAPAPAAPPRP